MTRKTNWDRLRDSIQNKISDVQNDEIAYAHNWAYKDVLETMNAMHEEIQEEALWIEDDLKELNDRLSNGWEVKFSTAEVVNGGTYKAKGRILVILKKKESHES